MTRNLVSLIEEHVLRTVEISWKVYSCGSVSLLVGVCSSPPKISLTSQVFKCKALIEQNRKLLFFVYIFHPNILNVMKYHNIKYLYKYR